MALTISSYVTWIVVLLLARPVLSPASENPLLNPSVEIVPDYSTKVTSRAHKSAFSLKYFASMALLHFRASQRNGRCEDVP
jgi:hypothetical protein